MSTIKKVSVNGQIYDLGGSGGGTIIETTYVELKSLKDSSALVPEQKYRITDYVSLFEKVLISDSSDLATFKSANHAFDLIVTANTNNTFYPIASAALHEGDEYFSKSDLSKWIIHYSFDNDSKKYPVDDTCKGFIYRMIDEYNNDVSFDFKNLLSAVSAGNVHNLSDNYSVSSPNYETDYKYFYLFSRVLSTSISDLGSATDASLDGMCENNKIDFTSFNSIAKNNNGCVLVTIKGILTNNNRCIYGNTIKDSTAVLFSKGSINFGSIAYNNIINTSFITKNIAGDISHNIINTNAEVNVGVQNWEQDNYSNVMGEINSNFVFPGADILLYGSNKNRVKFSNNIVRTESYSKLRANASITYCVLDGKFDTQSGNEISEEQNQKLIIGNGTDIKIIDKYIGV